MEFTRSHIFLCLLLTTFVFNSVYSGGGTLVTNPFMVFRIGQEYNFTCVPTIGNDPTSFRWFLDGSMNPIMGASEGVYQFIITGDHSLSCEYVYGQNESFTSTRSGPFDIFGLRPSVNLSVVGDPPVFLAGNNYTFNCEGDLSYVSPPYDAGTSVEIVLVANGNTFPTNMTTVSLPASEAMSAEVQCRALIEPLTNGTESRFFTVQPEPVAVMSALVPAPYYLNGTVQQFLCNSSISAFATSYTFEIIDQVTTIITQAGSIVNVTANHINPIVMTCQINISDAISSPSSNFTMDSSGVTNVTAFFLNYDGDDVSAHEGTDVMVGCRVEVVDPSLYVSVRWIDRNGTVLDTGMNWTYPVRESNAYLRCEGSTGYYWVTSHNELNITSTVAPTPPPIVELRSTHLFRGLDIDFECFSNASGLNITSYYWKLNSSSEAPSLVQTSTSNLTRRIEDQFFDVTCVASTDTFNTSEAALVSLSLQDPPAPTLSLIDDSPYLIRGNRFNFMCHSNYSSLVTNYCFMVDLNTTCQASALWSANLTMRFPTIHCWIEFNMASSALSPNITLALAEIPVPSIIALDDPSPSHYLAGRQYRFNCSSNVSEIVTSYQFLIRNDSSIDTVRQVDSVLTWAPHDDFILVIVCTVEVNVRSSDYSIPAFLLYGSGVVNVTLHVDNTSPFPGQNVTYTCDVTVLPEFRDKTVTYLWADNGTLAPDLVTQVQEFYVTSLEPLNYQCAAGTGLLPIVSQVVPVINPTASPPPTVTVVSSDLFKGLDIMILCNSPVADAVYTEYSFTYQNSSGLFMDTTVTATWTERFLTSPINITCSTSVHNYSSADGDAFVLSLQDVPVPSIVVLDEPDFYLTGYEYTLLCDSTEEALVTEYCFDTPTGRICQLGKHLNFTASEDVQSFNCSIAFNQAVSQPSAIKSIVGTGVKSVTASVSNGNPYPGTNVTLTCSVTLTPVAINRTVTYVWRQGQRDVTNSSDQAYDLYVPTGLSDAFECHAATGMVARPSNRLNIIAKTLPVPSVTVSNKPSDGLYELGHFHPLTCNSELADLVTGYNWYQDGQALADAHAVRHQVEALETNHTYTCTIQISLEESGHSPGEAIFATGIVRVHLENDGLPISTGLHPTFGSTIALACVVTRKPASTLPVSYQWRQDGVLVATGSNHTVTAFAGFNQSLTCTAFIGDDSKESEAALITARATLPVPSLQVTNPDGTLADVLQQTGSYTLTCVTQSLNLNATIVWYKDGVEIQCINEPSFNIIRYRNDIHDGDIACQVQGLEQSARSDVRTFSGQAPGRRCQGSPTCQGQGEQYTGQCLQERCVCSQGFVQISDRCD